MVAIGVIVERKWPARSYPTLPFWRLKGLSFFLLTGLLSPLIAIVCEATFGQARLFDGSRLGFAGGILVGLLAESFGLYWLHRAFHHFDFVFRWVHQLHHSLERVDTFAAVYNHPLEFLTQGTQAAIILSFVVGLPPLEYTVAIGILFGINLFQHMNIRTPRWVGWFIPRPESHNVHHERGVHAFNYSDLPVWDMIFGTYRNPAEFTARTGFYDFASLQMGAMLFGRDVSRK
jgi:sterol desaturase/sphingolipid hydroxylase (fatty acid hydroxylase superfamily)